MSANGLIALVLEKTAAVDAGMFKGADNTRAEGRPKFDGREA
jgi:hypothetical protein